MKTKRKFKTDAFEAIHSAALGLYETGVIDKAIMKGFDASCLVPSELSPVRSKTCGAQRAWAPKARFLVDNFISNHTIESIQPLVFAAPLPRASRTLRLFFQEEKRGSVWARPSLLMGPFL
ncbi:hypothetical protein [Pinirhizobacter soli]|uniref:hypothetical protein n=1 Tax=Pinirhizobacter soli TaxID=2786953 RepID=UPI00202A02FA|nr:hypothetical protein [Pinirhizobacter soli]